LYDITMPGEIDDCSKMHYSGPIKAFQVEEG